MNGFDLCIWRDDNAPLIYVDFRDLPREQVEGAVLSVLDALDSEDITVEILGEPEEEDIYSGA